jgi:pilus assembly protein FimV
VPEVSEVPASPEEEQPAAPEVEADDEQYAPTVPGDSADDGQHVEPAAMPEEPVATLPGPVDSSDAATHESVYSDDPVDTKLDLARAYLDMGDPVGARAMLEEVLEEGTQAQKDEATRLLAGVEA